MNEKRIESIDIEFKNFYPHKLLPSSQIYRLDPGSKTVEITDPGYVIQDLGSEIRKNLILEAGVKKHQKPRH